MHQESEPTTQVTDFVSVCAIFGLPVDDRGLHMRLEFECLDSRELEQ